MLSLYFYLPAFITGLLGNVHCVGMCGGLASALAARKSHKKRGIQQMVFSLLNNVGRLSTYMLMGAMATVLRSQGGIHLVKNSALDRKTDAEAALC